MEMSAVLGRLEGDDKDQTKPGAKAKTKKNKKNQVDCYEIQIANHQ